MPPNVHAFETLWLGFGFVLFLFRRKSYMKKLEETKKEREKAFLVGVIKSNKQDVEAELAELARLVETAGADVVGETYQLIREVTPATLIGSGKVEEIKEIITELGANLVVVDANLSGSQQNNLSNIFECKVIDRMGLILDIFATRATSQEGKMQVELAQLKYSLPRLSALSGTSARFGSGGVGTRGPGETKLELGRRRVSERIIMFEKEIEKLKSQRELKRQNRYNSNKKQVAIVGYTNAGKSTLLNLISKAGIYADDKLFATLDTTSRNVFLTPEVQIILTDTVGFISKLPHELVDAFASTLEEAQNADLLLHVVDVSNKDHKLQIETVNDTLKKIGASDIPQIVVYNKCDNLKTPMEIKENEVLISAKKNTGIDKLKSLIVEKLS